jgi:hypothetical protein
VGTHTFDVFTPPPPNAFLKRRLCAPP